MLIDEWWRRLHRFLRRDRYAAELEEEMRLHVELRAQANRASGMTAEAAAYAARRRFGNRATVQQASRDVWGFVSLDAFRQDVRYSVRTLRKHALLSTVVVATLTLGLGVGTGMFTYINAEFLRARVDREFGSFVRVYSAHSRDSVNAGRPRAKNTTLEDYLAFRDRATSFRVLAAYADLFATLGRDDPAEVRALLVTSNFFALYDLDRPTLGRLLLPSDVEAASPVVVVSERLWRDRLAADPGIIGKIVHFNGRPVTVVGVTPVFAGMVNKAAAWFPYTLATYLKRGDQLQRPGEAAWLEVEGRLRRGASRADAAAELRVLAGQQDRLHPGRITTLTVTDGSPIQEPGFGERLRWGVALALGALTIFILVVCVNVTTLLLSRAAARRQEIAVRLALGVGRARLVRMLLTETLLLAGVAGLASLVIAYHLPEAMRRWLFAAAANDLDTYSLAPDWRAFAYLGLVTVLAGTMAALAPALQSLKVNLTDVAKGRHSLPGGAGSGRLHGALIGAQVALSFFLLFSAGVFTHTARRATTFDPGFDTRNVLWTSVWLLHGAPRDRSWDTFHRTLEARIAAMPDVESVAFAYHDPYQSAMTAVETPGRGNRAVNVHWVSAGYFRTLGIPLVSGRTFREDDRTCGTSACPVVVSLALARTWWPNENPLGKALRDADGGTLSVVGVVRDVAGTRLGAFDEATIYRPFDATIDAPANPFVRFSGDGEALARRVTVAIKAMAPELSVTTRTIQSLRERLTDSLARLRTLTVLVCGIAVTLALIGIYGVVAFAVSQRTKELGIRLALGARKGDIHRAVFGFSGRPIAAGLMIGLAVTVAMTAAGVRVFSDALATVHPANPIPYLLTALALAVMALGAMAVPARRATRVDPMEVLRYE